MIPFLPIREINLRFEKELTAAFHQVLNGGWYIMGEELSSFEEEFSAYCQTGYSIGVANGLDALFISLKMLGIGKGDEVIVPSNTYIASWLAVSMTGATPVPAEPSIETYNINPNLIAEKITPRTKAIMPVHLYGQACEIEAIMKIAQAHNLYVVEDNAQSQGSTYNGKLTGSFGNINATSFYPGKNLGAFGDGGAITTNEAAMAKRAAAYRNYGSEVKYYNEVQGINSRLDELQAAFLRIKLRHLDTDNEARRKIADLYNELLKGVGDLILPKTAEGVVPVYHLYVVRTARRDTLAEYLKQHSISIMVHYPVPPHLQQAYADLGYKKGDFPIAEEIANTCLSLPIWPGMKSEEVEYVANTIKTYYMSN